MVAVDITPLPQSAGVALVFWGAVAVTFAAFLVLSVGFALRRRRGRRGPN